MASQRQSLDESQPAPIAQLLPLAFSGLYSVARTFWVYTIASAGLLLAPVSLLVLPAITFLLAPVTASVRLILDLVLAPYYTVVYVSQAVLPFYVIIGSALFCGTILGLCARLVVSLTGSLLLGRSGREGRGRAAGRPAQSAPTLRTPSKAKKRASVKFEQGA